MSENKTTTELSASELLKELPENPGWQPLAWFAGTIVALIVLGEVLIEFGLELTSWIGEGTFYLVEGSEEFLEDFVEDWLDLEPWEAELVTAWSMMPVKLLLAFFVLRAIWRWKKRKVFPAIKRWSLRQWLLLGLSWKGLWWPWKAGISLIGLGILVVLI